MRVYLLVCLAAFAASQPFARAAGAEVPAALVEPAVAIQVALAADATTGVASQAAALAKAADALGPAAAPIAAAVRVLEVQTDLDSMRRTYGDVNKAIVAYMRGGNLGVPEGIRVAYCPMARRQWLQKDGAIRNPYYGRAMVSCGDFTD